VTITAWRICKAKYAKSMWSGIGARSVAGRWQSKGVPVVYVSATISLATVEQLVHLDSADVLLKFVKCPVTFDESLVMSCDVRKLPKNWRSDPPPPSLRAIGDGWGAAAPTPVLAVPSAVISDEWNYVINPAHPRFRQLVIGKVQPFSFDPRLA